jgi:hypothetical protein
MVGISALIASNFGTQSFEYRDCMQDLEDFGKESKEWRDEDDA